MLGLYREKIEEKKRARDEIEGNFWWKRKNYEWNSQNL